MQDDIIGKRYGMLVVEEQVENTKGAGRLWLCRCDCGGTIEATTARLNSGRPNNCGCQKYEDLTGKLFGRVTVLRRMNERKLRGQVPRVLWECRCECGNITYKYTDVLKNNEESMCRDCADKYNASMARNGAGFVGGTQISKIRSTKLSKANKSGVRGVSQDSKTGKWRACIKFKGKSINLGYYVKFADAVAARKRGEEEYFGAFLEKHG